MNSEKKQFWRIAMKLLWDKLLTENHVIIQLRYTSIPQSVHYLFPTMKKANDFIEKSKTDSLIIQESIKVKQIKEIFT